MSGLPVTVAGKTGTAQTGGQLSDNGLFVCCAPSRHPDIVVAAVVERAGGGSYAAMTAGRILDAYYENQ
jgi:cell division protein FtsI/penicillin-binding protein 2